MRWHSQLMSQYHTENERFILGSLVFGYDNVFILT